MSSTYSGQLFLLGATGYLGSQILVEMNEQFPNMRVVALARNLTQERKFQLVQLHPNVILVEGTLDDEATIREQATKADITVHAADGEHDKSIAAIISGAREASKNRPGNPPIFMHIGGIATLSDESKGEPVDLDKIPKWIDTTFTHDQLPNSIYYKQAMVVEELGELKENPVKTLVLIPGWIYGVAGVYLPLRRYLNFARAAGHAGTIGQGQNRIPQIYVKDVARSVAILIKGSLEGVAGTGEQGVYLVAGDFENTTTMKQTQDAVGNILHQLGLVSQPGSKTLPLELVHESLPDRKPLIHPIELQLTEDRTTTSLDWFRGISGNLRGVSSEGGSGAWTSLLDLLPPPSYLGQGLSSLSRSSWTLASASDAFTG
ncbi:hypothetical protein AX16_001648 [Volvariella volvacea WC 439]|nr:hypothetical protein AX16_001648 [Volvariella volvacea WC 439]